MVTRTTARFKTLLRKGSGKTGTKTLVPAAVRDMLGGRPGDTVVFEEGSAWAAERAAARGKYFVVYLEKDAVRPPDEGEAADEGVVLEPLIDAVRRKARKAV